MARVGRLENSRFAPHRTISMIDLICRINRCETRKKVIKMAWIDQVFSAQQVRTGGVIRRSVASIERCCTMDLFLQEVKRRRFHAVRVADQVLVICNCGEMSVVC